MSSAAETTQDAPADDSGQGVLSRPFRWVIIGMMSLIMLYAFEALAVTTVMPTVSAEFDGRTLYALAFSGPLAVGVVGMVVAGNWSDRAGPTRALFTAVILFTVGLIIAGFASSMPMLVVGRLISGLGGGGLTVALFVLVARVFPERLHPQVFAAFSAAWVIPALVGPLIAGIVADTVGWRWVFLGVVVLVVLAMGMVVGVMNRVTSTRVDLPWKLSRVAWSLIAAGAVLLASLSAQFDGTVRWLVAVVAIVLAFLAMRPLLPAGALRARQGLPTIILLRGVVAGAYFAAEIYLPYFFTSHYELTPALAGLALSISGLSWSAMSWLQGKYSARISVVGSIRLGLALIAVAIGIELASSLLTPPVFVAIIGWMFAGAGMGTIYPRLSVAMLKHSTPESQGFNSSALAISDAIGAASALALTAAIVATLGGAAASSAGSLEAGAHIDVIAFTGCFSLALLLALLGLALSHRARS